MPDRELKARKKLQSASWRTTGTLGLAGLGLMAGAKGPVKLAAKAPKLRRLAAFTPERMKDASFKVGVASGGIGGMSAFNSARISSEEARRTKIKKSNTSAFGISHE
jgi:hypothetical protein